MPRGRKSKQTKKGAKSTYRAVNLPNSNGNNAQSYGSKISLSKTIVPIYFEDGQNRINEQYLASTSGADTVEQGVLQSSEHGYQDIPQKSNICENSRAMTTNLDAGSENSRLIDNSSPKLCSSDDPGNDNANVMDEEEVDDKDVRHLIRKLQSISVSDKETELSASQLEINDQEQEDEVFALQAIYGEDVHLFENHDSGLRTLKISINVELPSSLLVKVKLPSDSSECQKSTNVSHPSSEDDTEIENIYNFSVQHLPPFSLLCTLPKSYPCILPPYYILFCDWLDSRSLSKVFDFLGNMWTTDPGEVVLFKWADWLHTSALSYLGAEKELFINPECLAINENRQAVFGFSSVDVGIPRLLQYNEEKKNAIFRSSLHDCPICYSELPGSNIIKLQCQHIFCWNCIETYANVHVKDGTVNRLKCPDAECDNFLPPSLLKKVLGDDAFQRWENLLLQKTLDSMSDLVYCPRCEHACLEDEDHHAQCANCFFNFCSLCRERRHVGQTCVTPEMRLQILRERQNSGQVGGDQRRKEQELINELLSLKQILVDAKQCPKCKMAISKTEGCNKMTCGNCGQYFCYKCNKAIDGYDHFGEGKCVLFAQQEIQIWERAMNDRQLVGQAWAQLHPNVVYPCPNCRQMNAKQGNNNHVCCWSCQSHFCALCGKVVRRSAEHYGPRGCKQHTAD